MENQSFEPVGPGQRAVAEEQVKLPAIFLMVLGGLGVLMALWGIVQGLSGANEAQLAQAMNDPNMPEQAKELVARLSKLGPVQNIIGLLVSAFILFGAMKMKKLQSRGLALAASIVAFLPLWSCCCAGIPLGIWSLVVLNKPEVKASFT